jgi:ADP-ribose pyrophosphatase YjhB (NUDIX family)
MIAAMADENAPAPRRNSHCSYCGAAFEETPWPRRCVACDRVSYVNPIPVSVVLVPVDGGLLLVRRDFGATKGRLALPGGFVNAGETWQQAGAREVFEETGVRVEPEALELFRLVSAPDDTLLVFSVAPPVAAADLPAFVANEEVSECTVCSGPTELAFPIHTRVAAEYFASRAQSRERTGR